MHNNLLYEQIKKMIINLISICHMTRNYIDVKLLKREDENTFQSRNREIIKLIVNEKEGQGTLKFQIEPGLLKMSLLSLLDEFDPEMFHMFIQFASVPFIKKCKQKFISIESEGAAHEVSFTLFEKLELFNLNKKRKDDMMSSLLKFIQRNVLNNFKQKKQFKLVRNVKEEFRKEFFENDKSTEKVYYSTLFNRKQLIIFRKNKKLIQQFRQVYRTPILETLLHNYFLKKVHQQFFDPRSDKMYSGNFCKSLKKKQMNLSDALFAFYSIEDLIFNKIQNDE